VRSYLPTVLVVDDGSTDDTGRIAAAAGARVLRHPANRGKGAALATGWRTARDDGLQWALCLDGDGQHDPAEVPAFLVRAAQTGAALVVGNRFANGNTSIPALRRAVNRWMSRRISRLAGVVLPDTQCGLRLLDLGLWARLAPAAQRFEIESELIVAALAARARVEFVPIRPIYKAGSSKIHPVTDTWRWFKWWRRQTTRNGHDNRAANPARGGFKPSPP
jgi:glycosyltransferase involved in cell wall biosynthesis